jgi:2-C-methyl-D-erythritol 4-phosphate cytidylyltransferase
VARFAVILPAAGQSTRFEGFRRKKPFVELKGRPVWVRTVDHFIVRKDVVQTILVVAPEDMEWFRDQFRPNLAFLEITVVEGGATRSESVRNGLAAIQAEADFVAVHDAARPLLTNEWIDQIFAAAIQHKAAIPGLKISSTVKRLTDKSTIEATIDRSRLVAAQTPQVFERRILEEAIRDCPDWESATDEASVVEQSGQLVRVIDGWPMNIKITTAEDFRIAELFINALPRPEILSGLSPFDDK